MKKHQNLLTEKDQKILYLVHHMHHFKRGESIQHEIHHCPLFSEKDMKGEKYRIKHLLVKGKLFHILDKLFFGFLYDHLNNSFKIAIKKKKNKKYSVLLTR